MVGGLRRRWFLSRRTCFECTPGKGLKIFVTFIRLYTIVRLYTCATEMLSANVSNIIHISPPGDSHTCSCCNIILYTIADIRLILNTIKSYFGGGGGVDTVCGCSLCCWADVAHRFRVFLPPHWSWNESLI